MGRDRLWADQAALRKESSKGNLPAVIAFIMLQCNITAPGLMAVLIRRFTTISHGHRLW
jgi:hypothetical protein